jgi:urea transport system substrate-binding protein
LLSLKTNNYNQWQIVVITRCAVQERTLYLSTLALLILMCVGIAGYYCMSYCIPTKKRIIKLGILHSLTGNLAKAETPLVKTALLAVEEINNEELIKGAIIQTIIADGKSDWPTFAKEAERLIVQEHVSAIVGCYTSSSRKSVKPVVEKYNNLLVYATDHEGLEVSPNIIYVGPVPNQHTLPGIMWCFNNLGSKFFLLGSDLIYPRVSHEIAKDHITSLGGTIVGETFVDVDHTNFDSIIELIKKAKPDVVISHLSGEINNVNFYRALEKHHLTPEELAVMSFTIAESDFLYIGIPYMVGHYITQCYMQSIHSATNEKFIAAFKNKYGNPKAVIDAAMETEYDSVYLWAAAVNKKKTARPDVIKYAMLNESMNAPQGTVFVDPESRNSWQPVRVGKVKKDGQMRIIWTSDRPIQPIAYPISRSKNAWQNVLMDFYKKMGHL